MRVAALFLAVAAAVFGQGLRAGAARRDVTPREPVPMWGYGARHDKLSAGVLDPLYADALVIEAGGKKLAIVGLDLGRSPGETSLENIRKRIRERAGIEWSLVAGSHTHGGPVLELTNQPGKGQGRFDAALRYYAQLEDAVAGAIEEANSKLEPVTVAAGSAQLEGFNRNRHTKLDPKPCDREMAVLRFDGADGKPRAVVVNFTAHPTMLGADNMKFSADWVGAMKNHIARETGARVIFMQGASGDQSVNGAGRTYQQFGEAIGAEAVKLTGTLRPAVPKTAALEVREERFRFRSRTDFANPILRTLYAEAFFPELIPNFVDEYAGGIRPRLTVALLNGEIPMVGVSGEFFAAHALRLKERVRLRPLFFFGYANGYHQYFPTIEAVAEGGYGADASVSPAEVGAGEHMMDAALTRIYQLLGRIK
ncbi:MAG: neutral/alkaline non-lysosomal ceramidase N-terminal domain-containing protein [Bryobacteraceae bacterium]